jgi:molybdopterin synthase catalytic subunit
MQLKVNFYSYFKELTGCAQTTVTLPAGSTLGDLLSALSGRFPKLVAMQRSLLLAVGVDYQDRGYVVQDGDEISLFPPVQGG